MSLLVLDDADDYFSSSRKDSGPTYSLIIHPKSAGRAGGGTGGAGSQLSAEGDGSYKPLWRKRETVRQERTVHYTTIDAEGAQQVQIKYPNALHDTCIMRVHVR